MKHLMPSCVSSYQSAFVQKRQIQDNISVAHECFHYLKLKKIGVRKVVIKVDISKAYDKIE